MLIINLILIIFLFLYIVYVLLTWSCDRDHTCLHSLLLFSIYIRSNIIRILSQLFCVFYDVLLKSCHDIFK